MPRIFRFDVKARRLSELTAYPLETSQTWSSAPYPATWNDAASAGADLIGGSLRVGILVLPPDESAASADLVGGALRAGLSNYAIYQDMADAGADMAGGQLKTVLKSYSLWPPEPVDTIADLVSGQLKRVLIPYDNWALLPENADASANLISGYLGP